MFDVEEVLCLDLVYDIEAYIPYISVVHLRVHVVRLVLIEPISYEEIKYLPQIDSNIGATVHLEWKLLHYDGVVGALRVGDGIEAIEDVQSLRLDLLFWYVVGYVDYFDEV